MLRLKIARFGNSSSKLSLSDIAAGEATDLTFCYAALHKVSRSFAAVIQQLPHELRDAVCLFYLVLRGLDSIEDDASFSIEKKIPLLREFYQKNHLPDWSIKGVGDSDDYMTLLANYGRVARAFQRLDPEFQEVIDDICRKMGNGMADFSERPIRTMKDYDLYCYYVAGLVGVGLSHLFAISGIEDDTLHKQPELSVSMGLFLQKTNIVRDFHEDLHSDRLFWPEEAWRKYADSPEALEASPDSTESLACLNALINDAMRHAIDSLAYLSEIKDEQVFRFCAIPQAMAIATLEKIYNNPEVFTSVVKIRKGLAAMMLIEMNDFRTAARYFSYFATAILNKIDPKDPSSGELQEKLHTIIAMCRTARMISPVEVN